MKTTLLYTFLLLPFIGLAQTKESFTVHFEFNKYNLTAATKASLDSFIAAAKTLHSKSNIELNGHCDFVGNDVYNDHLSIQRVTAVRQYLLQHNFALTAFSVTKGHGKREPLNNNATDKERMLNRRVEITVTRAVTQAGDAVITTATPSKEIKKDTPVEVPAKAIIKALPPLPEKKLSEQIADTAVKPGSSIVLKNLNFVGGRHQLLDESFPILQELLDVMRKNKNLKIEVQGHICCLPGNVDGFDEETETNNLSEERAKAVKEYLVKNGIEPGRVAYVGLGHSYPIYSYPEKTEMEKTANRRVEIKILSK